MNERAKRSRPKRVVLAIVLVAFALLAKPSDWYPRLDQVAVAMDVPGGDNVVGGRAAVHIDGVLESPLLCLDTENIVGVNCNVDPADDSTWTFAPGGAATIEWGGFDGNAAPNLPTGDDANDLCRLTVLADNGATILRTLHSATTCAPLGTTYDYRMTTTGTSTGTPVAGTFRLRIEIRDFTAGVAQYQVDSDTDCADCIPETTFRGAIRAGMDVTAITHNGYPSGSLHAYTVPTESMGFVVTHTPAQPNQASRAVQVKTVTDAQTVLETVSTSAETDGTTSASYQVTETYPAARSTLGVEWTITGNSALTGLKWTHINAVTGPVVADGEFEARRPGFFDVDPRLAATHLIKMNDNAFDTPPMSGDDCCTRLTSDLAFFATRLTNARGEGLVGASIQVTQTIRDDGGFADPESCTGGVTTQGGEAGWTAFCSWTQTLPAGVWRKVVDVTAPSNIDANTHLIAPSFDYALSAVNPDVVGTTMVALRQQVGLEVKFLATSVSDGTVLLFDTNPNPHFAVLRNLDGEVQYLDANEEWQPLTASAYLRALNDDAGPTWSYTFTPQSVRAWGDSDFMVQASGYVGGAPADGVTQVANVHGALTTMALEVDTSFDNWVPDAVAWLGIAAYIVLTRRIKDQVLRVTLSVAALVVLMLPVAQATKAFLAILIVLVIALDVIGLWAGGGERGSRGG